MRPPVIAASILSADLGHLAEKLPQSTAVVRRLDPRRRDGPAIRAEHCFWPGRGRRCQARDEEATERASYDRRARALPRGIRGGERRVHEPPAGGREAEEQAAEKSEAADEVGPERVSRQARERQSRAPSMLGSNRMPIASTAGTARETSSSC